MRVNGQDRSVLSVSATLGLQFHNPRIKDSDGDGVADDVDGCKEQAEDVDQFEDNDGCPEADNDKDGLLDAADRCPVEAEDIDQFEDSDGCLDADNDKDGVVDTADTCAMNAEDMDKFEDSDGCPELDNDKDGIPDEKDKAPDAAETFNGYQDRDGAPDEVPAEVKKFNGRIEGILFKTGSAEILPKSYTVLDQAVAMLQQFPEIRMEIQGHTDDVGDDAQNLALSQDRAQSVVNYMVSKGIAADRLVAKGYGETTPEVPNDSEVNRARNRRVEFHVIRENHENRRGDGK
jgi:OOP family OmpA-OmpF porin